MQAQLNQIVKLIILFVSIFSLSMNTNAQVMVPTGVVCSDTIKSCVDAGGPRIIDGVKVSKACWKYAYFKTCQFPSKNDCHLINHCYEVSLRECLLYDSLGNCVNQKKEFSCKKGEIGWIDHKRVKRKITGDEAKRIVCKGMPCLDGNCVDKSYEEDQDMMNSVSQLYAASKAAGAKDLNFKLFGGGAQHCTKKPTEYTNCCHAEVKGWGGNFGAGCNADERDLIAKRAKKLCVYVGKTTNKDILPVRKHYYCCFGNMLNKVFQVEGRKQLGRNFGTPESTDCGGLTLQDILKLDFEKMDFSEFIAEIKGRMKVPNVTDIEARAKGSIPGMKKYNDRGREAYLDPENKKAGVSSGMVAPLQDEGDYGK